MHVEVRSRGGWRRLAPDHPPPAIDESDLFELRGLPPGATVALGPALVSVDDRGHASRRFLDDEELRGHLGLIEVRVGDRLLGEIEVVPGKVSRAAFDVLRSELERTWTGLLFDPEGVSRLRADLPPPEELWGRIEEPVREIILEPRTKLVRQPGITRLERVRRASDMTPALLRAGAAGRPGLGGVLTRSTEVPENALVAATLRSLHAYSRRRSDGTAVASATARMMRRHPFDHRSTPVRGVTLGMRADARYRRVLDVWRILQHPMAAATEGPGELRLGLKGMSRLYEYWVYLQVLQACITRYGQPLDPGFAVLARQEHGGRSRLELPPGTTVTFPGDVSVAFEPVINSRGDGWGDLEYVPHPDAERAQLVATPDVVVFQPAPDPWAVVIDAKYVARGMVERDAARLHEKYARMRLRGEPVVRSVWAAHPHQGFTSRWAGYGHLAFVPGAPMPSLPLPAPDRPAASAAPSAQDTEEAAPVAEARAPAHGAGGDAPPARLDDLLRPVTVVADQYWMHQWLGDRRIHLGRLQEQAAGSSGGDAVMVLPRIPQLESFAHAVERLGWRTVWTQSPTRDESLRELTRTVQAEIDRGRRVVVVSDDPRLRERLKALDGPISYFVELDQIPPPDRW